MRLLVYSFLATSIVREKLLRVLLKSSPSDQSRYLCDHVSVSAYDALDRSSTSAAQYFYDRRVTTLDFTGGTDANQVFVTRQPNLAARLINMERCLSEPH